MVITSKSHRETHALGKKLGTRLKNGLILLYGDLGAGKTTFIRGLAQGLGIRSRINSPTFTYSRIHKGKRSLHHFDCYRLKKEDFLISQELFEALEKKNTIIAIEWAERVQKYLPRERIEVYFEYVGEETRRITVLSSPRKLGSIPVL